MYTLDDAFKSVLVSISVSAKSWDIKIHLGSIPMELQLSGSRHGDHNLIRLGKIWHYATHRVPN